MKANNPITEEERKGIEETLRHCPEGTYEALAEFRETGSIPSFHKFLVGVLERHMEPESSHLLSREDLADLKFIDDLGIDSMTMMEIVIAVEECLGITIENEDLMEIQTYGELDKYVASKLS